MSALIVNLAEAVNDRSDFIFNSSLTLLCIVATAVIFG